MKRMLLLFFTFFVATMSYEGALVERIATTLNMTREEVQSCLNNTGVTLVDIMNMNVITEDGLQTADFNESALRVGCFITCFSQKKGLMINTRIDTKELKKMMKTEKERSPALLAIAYQIVDKCAIRVRSKTNECEVSLGFVLCFVDEMERATKGKNNVNK